MGSVNTSGPTSLTTTHLVHTENPEVDGRGLTLVEELQEQVVKITRTIVGEQSDEDVDIPGKFALHSDREKWGRRREGSVRDTGSLTTVLTRNSCSPWDGSDRLIPRNPLRIPSLQIIMVPSPRIRTQNDRDPITRHGPISQPSLSASRQRAQ